MNNELNDAIDRAGATLETTGVLIVDHGSRRQESNDLLLQVASMFEQATDFRLVAPAHMELAEPSIEAGFSDLVERGAKLVIAFPYFLSPGRHWKNDIPALVAEAAKKHPGVDYLVTAPLGLHPLMAQIMSDRITRCLEEPDVGCDVCREPTGCRIARSPGTDAV